MPISSAIIGWEGTYKGKHWESSILAQFGIWEPRKYSKMKSSALTDFLEVPDEPWVNPLHSLATHPRRKVGAKLQTRLFEPSVFFTNPEER